MTDLGYQLQWNNAVLTNGIPIAADYPRPNAVAQSEVPTIPNLQASTITISPDGRFLAVSLAAPPFDVQIWSIDQGCLLSRLEGHLIGARWLKFFPDGNRLRSTAWDDLEMKIWDTSALINLPTSPKTGFLRLDCPCTMTFSLDTAHTVGHVIHLVVAAVLTKRHDPSPSGRSGKYGGLRLIVVGPP